MKKHLKKYSTANANCQGLISTKLIKQLKSIKKPYQVAPNPLVKVDYIDQIINQCTELEKSLYWLTSNITANYEALSDEEREEKIHLLLGFATNNEITELLNDAFKKLSNHDNKVKEGIPDNVIQFDDNLAII